MKPSIPTTLIDFHAQAQVIHGVYLTDLDKDAIEVCFPRLEGQEAIMEIRRKGPGDEIPWLVFTNQVGYLDVQDGEGHTLHEIGRLDLPADSDKMRAHAAKSIRWLMTQDLNAIRQRRGLPPH